MQRVAEPSGYKELSYFFALAETGGRDFSVGFGPGVLNFAFLRPFSSVLFCCTQAFGETEERPAIVRQAFQVVAINLFGIREPAGPHQVAPNECRTGIIHPGGSSYLRASSCVTAVAQPAIPASNFPSRDQNLAFRHVRGDAEDGGQSYCRTASPPGRAWRRSQIDACSLRAVAMSPLAARAMARAA